MSSTAHDPAPARRATMREMPFAGRLSFAIATRMVLRKLPVGPDRGYLSITFDDIPRSAWTVGGAILALYGVRATYYLSGDLCGKFVDGRVHYRRSDVGDMRAAGHELGSHLFHHRSTLGMSRAEILREIALNDSFLREVIGSEFSSSSLAYPFGEVSLAAKFLSCRRFSSARGVQPGLNARLTDRDHLRVLPADNRFAAETDWTAIIQNIAREKLWGIVLAHGVDDSGHDYSCPPQRLEAIIQSAQAAGVSVLPVRDIMNHLVVSGREYTT